MVKNKTYVFINLFLLVLILLPIFFILLKFFIHLPTVIAGKGFLLADNRIWNLLAKSLLIGLSVTFFTTIIALPLAFLIEKYKIPFSNTIIFLAILPLLFPPYVYAVSWIYILGEEGWFNQFLINIFNLPKPPLTIYGFGGSIFVLSIWIFPISLLFFVSSFRYSKRFEDAAKLYGSNLKMFYKITLPLAKPGIISGMIISFILAISNFSVPGVLRVNVFPTEIFTQFGAFFNHEEALFLCLPVIFISAVMIYFMINMISKQKKFEIVEYRYPKKTLSAKLRATIISFLLLFFIIVIALPLISLLLKSKSISVYLNVLSISGNQIFNTLFLGVSGAIILTIAGFNFAYFARRLSATFRRIIDIAVFIPFIIPGIIYGISLIYFWNQPVFSNLIIGSVPVVLLSFFKFLPVPYYICLSSLSKIPVKFEEAALLGGIRKIDVIKKIIVPLSKKGILGAFFLSLIFCVGELDTAILLNPPGFETLSIHIFSILHYGANEMLAALCVLQIVLILLVVLLGWRWIKNIIAK